MEDPASWKSHVKGAGFLELIRHYEKSYGGCMLAELVAALPEKVRAHLDDQRPTLGVLPSEWYPVAVLRSLLEGMLLTIPPENRRQFISDSARSIMVSNLHGVYKILFALMATPDRFVKYSQRVFRTYFDSGTFRAQLPEPDRCEIQISDWRGRRECSSISWAA